MNDGALIASIEDIWKEIQKPFTKIHKHSPDKKLPSSIQELFYVVGIQSSPVILPLANSPRITCDMEDSDDCDSDEDNLMFRTDPVVCIVGSYVDTPIDLCLL